MAAPKLEQRPAAQAAEARARGPSPLSLRPPLRRSRRRWWPRRPRPQRCQDPPHVPPAPAYVPPAPAYVPPAPAYRRPGVCAAAAASPCGAAGAAAARQDHRAHSDHQQVPRPATDVPDALAGHLPRRVDPGPPGASSVCCDASGHRTLASGARNAGSPSGFASRRPSATRDR